MSVSDRNRIEMALLGPIFGMPSATLTAFGVDPQTVPMTNQLGMLGWDIAGSGFVLRPKSTRGMGKVDGGSTKVVETESLPLTGQKPSLEGPGPNALDFTGGAPNALSGIGNSAHNAAIYAKLKVDLRTTADANDIVVCLRATGQLPPSYVTKSEAAQNG